MHVKFYTESNAIFEKILLNLQEYVDLFKDDYYVYFRFTNNRIIYTTTSGSIYTLSDGILEFTGLRNSMLNGCGLFQINRKSFINVITGEEEEMSLFHYESSKPEMDWYSSESYKTQEEYNYEKADLNIVMLSNNIGKKFQKIKISEFV